MRYLIIFILSTSFLLGSCSREDSFVPQEDEIIENPPVEVEVGDINGIVKGNNGELLSSATVKLYNETELINETTTNSFGEFDFVDVLENDNYKLFVIKDSYYASVAFISEDHFDNEDIEVDLFFGSLTSPIGQPTDLLDPNFVLLSGTISNSEGELINTSILILSAFNSFAYQAEVKEGNFAVLIPKGSEIFFTIYQFQTGNCQLFPEEIFLGPFDEDTEHNFQSTESISSNTIEGVVTVCDSTVLESGYIEFWSHDEGENIQVEIEDGYFTFELSGCEIGNTFFQVYDDYGFIVHSGFFHDDETSFQISIGCESIFEVGSIIINFDNGSPDVALEAFLIFNEEADDQIMVFSPNENQFFLNAHADSTEGTAEVNELIFSLEGEAYFLNSDLPLNINYEIEADLIIPYLGEFTTEFEAELSDFTGINKIAVTIEINSPILIN